jgi:YD repeat-containing protein
VAYANPTYTYFPTRLTDPQGNATNATYDRYGRRGESF